jgi:hypothetical protein
MYVCIFRGGILSKNRTYVNTPNTPIIIDMLRSMIANSLNSFHLINMCILNNTQNKIHFCMYIYVNKYHSFHVKKIIIMDYISMSFIFFSYAPIGTFGAI